MFLSNTFQFGMQKIHNGFLFSAVIYGRTEGDTHYPEQRFPETYYATREECMAVASNIIALIPSIKPRKVVTKGEADKNLKKVSKNGPSKNELKENS